MKREEFEGLKKESVGHALIKAARLYNDFAFEAVQKEFGNDNLKQSHLGLFPYIPFEGITVIELAKAKGISKQAVSVLVNELVEMGILIKQDNPEDRRSQIIRFNEEPDSKLFKGLQFLVNLDVLLLEVLGQKESTHLKKTLQKIISHFNG